MESKLGRKQSLTDAEIESHREYLMDYEIADRFKAKRLRVSVSTISRYKALLKRSEGGTNE